MDAPPPQEDVRPFVHVAGLIAAAGLHAPRVLEADVAQRLSPPRRPRQRALPRRAPSRAGARRRAPRRRPDARRDRRARRAGSARSRPPRCRRTTTRCCGASSRSFPTGASRASAASTWDAPRPRRPGRRRATSSSPPRWRSRVVAVHRDWMPRNLMVADPNPGILDFQDAVCGPIALRRRLAAARRVHLVGRGARARLGGPLLGGGAQGRAAGGGRLRRVLAQRRMDRPAAPPEGARHLLAPQASRRQARVQRRPAALLRLRAQGRDRATRRCGRSAACSSR